VRGNRNPSPAWDPPNPTSCRSKLGLLEGARKVAGGEARLCQREPPDHAHAAILIRAACRRFARSVLLPIAQPRFYARSMQFRIIPHNIQLGKMSTRRSEGGSKVVRTPPGGVMCRWWPHRKLTQRSVCSMICASLRLAKSTEFLSKSGSTFATPFS
jgi:hypothetical protein